MDSIHNNELNGGPDSAVTRALASVDAVLKPVERLLAGVAMLALLFAMGIVSIDAVGRYAFNSPLRWVTESLTLYVLPGIFFFGLALSMAKRSHIVVDILIMRSSPNVKVAVNLIANILAFLFFVLILAVCTDRLAEAWRTNEVEPGVIIWPRWPSFAIVCIGSLMASLRSLHSVGLDLAAIFGSMSARAAVLRHGDDEVFE